MSNFISAAFVLRCDGCDEHFGYVSERPDAYRTRAIAYQEGWRYPVLTIDGHTGPVDLCANCLTTGIFGNLEGGDGQP